MIESVKIQQALGDNVLAVHHIGSTSIPSILAKPIIDILVEASQIEDVDQRSGCMSDLGYEVMDEYGIEGRRYFRKSDKKGNRTFHVHAFERASSHIVQHLVFRDFLLAHPQRAKEYSDLKTALSDDGVISKTEYQNAKTSFIRATQEDAIKWYQNQK